MINDRIYCYIVCFFATATTDQRLYYIIAKRKHRGRRLIIGTHSPIGLKHTGLDLHVGPTRT